MVHICGSGVAPPFKAGHEGTLPLRNVFSSLINRLVQDEQRNEQQHMQQLQQQHGAGGAFTRVIQQGPVTYTFTYGGDGGGGGEMPPDIDSLLGLPGMDGIGGIDFANLHVRPPLLYPGK